MHLTEIFFEKEERRTDFNPHNIYLPACGCLDEESVFWVACAERYSGLRGGIKRRIAVGLQPGKEPITIELKTKEPQSIAKEGGRLMVVGNDITEIHYQDKDKPVVLRNSHPLDIRGVFDEFFGALTPTRTVRCFGITRLNCMGDIGNPVYDITESGGKEAIATLNYIKGIVSDRETVYFLHIPVELSSTHYRTNLYCLKPSSRDIIPVYEWGSPEQKMISYGALLMDGWDVDGGRLYFLIPANNCFPMPEPAKKSAIVSAKLDDLRFDYVALEGGLLDKGYCKSLSVRTYGDTTKIGLVTSAFVGTFELTSH